MTRNDARAAFAATGLTYADLGRDDLLALRNAIDKELKASALIKGYRSDRAVRMVDWPTGWAAITCRAYYFEKREAVTFNPEGFIGFGGWADDKNVVPIIAGFLKWLDALVDRRRAAA
ncbi:hypothetical protein D9M68_150760 [compost metagenome]